ncbi:hypothetical protein PHYBOEH_009582 [Phytophthora boehmeriae]|uniref:Pre-mRNA-splicing factor Syf1-like N-terminal HAT-repeats domain-containing protein n=1 Tax=Phytophthora boehmeriae TaxID=109152 RepID=A0A8T1VSU4_9STRA|nr:hypothetical protein PHYBOEH_009582 [Phytophthora boehmeriae]
MADISSWDASGVVARAKALIHASNYEKVSEARQEVDDTLARWVAAVGALSDAMSVARGSTAVVALWRQYAALEMELRQFKQATKVFERAVSCPVAGTSTALWLQYTDFCVQRKKYSNARKIFVRALKTLPDREQAQVWQQFHAFVRAHVDPKLSLEMLQQQVMPEKFPVSSTAPAPTAVPATSTATLASDTAPANTPAVPAAQPAIPSSLQPQQDPQPSVATSGANAAPTVSLVDPVVAFIDKTGELNPTTKPSPLAVESGENVISGAQKRGPTDPRLAGDAKRIKQDKPEVVLPGVIKPETATVAEPTAYFSHIPETLPFIPTCPHLLFDSVGDGEAQKQIDNELLERLSDVLGDSAVFAGVRDLRDNQRVRDREMLYRWQDLVGMQMKEGSELFARHVALEMQHGFSDPRGLIAIKTQHLEQRREFSNRCQMSQQQFIEICAMDRVNALKAQQISLENMKIPEMKVTTESEAISLQRAIVGLILEAEKLWREENQPKSTKTLPHPVTLLLVVLAAVSAKLAVAAVVGKTLEDLEIGVVMGMPGAEIVTRVVTVATLEVILAVILVVILAAILVAILAVILVATLVETGAAISGTFSRNKAVLLLPLLPLHNRIHDTTILDSRLHLGRKSSSLCLCMIMLRSGCSHRRSSKCSNLVSSSSSPMARKMRNRTAVTNMEIVRALCLSNRDTVRHLLALTTLDRKTVNAIVVMAMAS